MNWLLLAVIAILVICTIKGYASGFIKTVFAIFSLIVALIVASVATPTVSKVLQSNDKIYTMVYEKIEETVDFEGKIKKQAEQKNFIEKLPVPNSIKETLVENNNSEVYSSMAVDNFEEYVVSLLSKVVINALAFAVTFLAMIILLAIVCRVLNLISKLPLLNELNKTAGLLVGLLQGFIIIWILFIVITVFSGSNFGQSLFEMINKNKILTMIYDNNLLLKLITDVSKMIF